MTKIQTFGPKEVYEGRILRYEYYAEAVGSDGKSYYATGRARPTPYVDVQEYFRERIGAVLQGRMQEEGVWDGD